ncbi:MAG: universal stress protein [Ferruginibacter sp.]|jgi:nucleotide-binding universal stress UspA family protein
MKILIATDGSAHSKAMVKQFAGRAFAPNTKVRIISVYQIAYISYASEVGPMNDFNPDKFLIKSAEDATKNASAILRKVNPKLSISTAVIEGYPKSVILQEAEKFGANLIVVGSHGHGAIAGFLLGSVSQAVALHARCSVEIVR